MSFPPSPELSDMLHVIIPEDQPCCSKIFGGREDTSRMPITRSCQIKIELEEIEEEQNLSPRLRKRKTSSFSPISPRAKCRKNDPQMPKFNLKKSKQIEDEEENINYGELEEEAPDESSSPDSSRPPSPRIIPRRNCAEVAKKKIIVERRRKIPKGEGEEPTESNESREGSCDRHDCPAIKACCLNVTENCLQVQTEPKTFHHLTKHEHICNNCYDSLWKMSGRFGKRFVSWKAKWSEESRCHPGVRAFISDQLLPYWIQCQYCNKYRRIDTDHTPTTKFMANFTCISCEEIEDSAARDARDHNWIYSINSCPLLQNSPALFYLGGGHYFYDELGMSPVEIDFNNKDCQTERFMSPFNIPDLQSKAFCLRPDMMDFDEVEAFPEYSVESVLYLAIRNLIVTLWNMNPFEYLTLEKCIPQLICRGLARIWYVQELARIHEFLRVKSIINYGILDLPPEITNKTSLDIIVVGAGISGLSAARQLRSFGAKVKVFEAKTVVGGRMQDDWSLGVAVGCGAQLVTGSINNPIILMCEQTGVRYRIVESQCPLIDGVSGGSIHWKLDKYVEEHLNCILDALYHWKNHSRINDASLEDQIQKVHQTLLSEGGVRWGEEEERVLQFHLGNIEFSCGSKMDDVSWRNWDQNEAVALFAGSHALLTDGSKDILKKLVDGTDVRFNHEVVKIEWLEKRQKMQVTCRGGKKFNADKVLVALPLAILQKKEIIFNPPLPKKKIQALDKIGAGLIEKVAVKFPRRFWKKHLTHNNSDVDYFSLVPKSKEDRGLFNMFYDFSSRESTNKKDKNHYVLMSYVCGDSVEIVNEMSDEEVADKFVETLREMFPDENVPDPDGYVVTHWGRDPHIGMSYSYVRVGGIGENYDHIAESIQKKIYFAGECTNRFFPQTMTGAYVSGLREAGKIMEDFRKAL